MNTVLLFEDSQEIRESFVDELRQRLYSLGAELKVVTEDDLKQHTSTGDDDKTFEATILRMLDEYLNVSLVIADRDLSQLQNGFSEASISRVCEVRKIPVALYARVNNSSQTRQRVFDVENRLDLTSEFRIVLDSNNLGGSRVGAFVSEICNIYGGFHKIRAFLDSLDLSELKMGAFDCIAKLLEKEDYLFDLKKFSSGNTGFLPANKLDAGKWLDLKSEDDRGQFMRRSMSYFIGYWLHESLLKYPGVLGNQTAVASYLNINEDDFKQIQVQKFFSYAEYKGPFYQETNKQWWIADLDQLLYENGVDDGLELLANKGIDVRPCFCSKGKNTKAGYYCIFTEKPVSKTYSVGSGELPWIPKGAKLSRMNEEDFEEIAPWMGW